MKKVTGIILAAVMVLNMSACAAASGEKADPEATTAAAEDGGASAQTEDVQEDTAQTEDTVQTEAAAQAAEEVIDGPVTHIGILTGDFIAEQGLVDVIYPAAYLKEDEQEKYPELQDTLTSANAQAAENKETVMDGMQTMASANGLQAADGIRYSNSQRERIVRSDTRVVSILDIYDIYTGQEQRKDSFYGTNLNPATGKVYRLSRIVRDQAAFLEYLKQDIREHYEDAVLDDMEEKIDKYDASYFDLLSWTVGYEGISVYFDAGKLADAAVGAVIAEVPYSSGLMETVCDEIPEEYAQWIYKPQDSRWDCDGDGKAEVLSVVQDEEDAETHMHSLVTITVGEHSVTSDNPCIEISDVYRVHKAQGQELLYLVNKVREDEDVISVFDITGGDIKKLGDFGWNKYSQERSDMGEDMCVLTEAFTDPAVMLLTDISDKAK